MGDTSKTQSGTDKLRDVGNKLMILGGSLGALAQMMAWGALPAAPATAGASEAPAAGVGAVGGAVFLTGAALYGYAEAIDYAFAGYR